jgi:hypothetical protein
MNILKIHALLVLFILFEIMRCTEDESPVENTDRMMQIEEELKKIKNGERSLWRWREVLQN